MVAEAPTLHPQPASFIPPSLNQEIDNLSILYGDYDGGGVTAIDIKGDIVVSSSRDGMLRVSRLASPTHTNHQSSTDRKLCVVITTILEPTAKHESLVDCEARFTRPEAHHPSHSLVPNPKTDAELSQTHDRPRVLLLDPRLAHRKFRLVKRTRSSGSLRGSH
eukprot:813530-Pyramimonas_sp.AAC.1